MGCKLEKKHVEGKKFSNLVIETNKRKLIVVTTIYNRSSGLETDNYFIIRINNLDQIHSTIEHAMSAWNNCAE